MSMRVTQAKHNADKPWHATPSAAADPGGKIGLKIGLADEGRRGDSAAKDFP